MMTQKKKKITNLAGLIDRTGDVDEGSFMAQKKGKDTTTLGWPVTDVHGSH